VAGDSVADRTAALLAPYIGAFNARVWVKTVAERELSRPVAELTIADLPAVLDGLRHSLNTLIGQEAADGLVERIRREVRS
jgi:hypothetical protein